MAAFDEAVHRAKASVKFDLFLADEYLRATGIGHDIGVVSARVAEVVNPRIVETLEGKKNVRASVTKRGIVKRGTRFNEDQIEQRCVHVVRKLRVELNLGPDRRLVRKKGKQLRVVVVELLKRDPNLRRRN